MIKREVWIYSLFIALLLLISGAIYGSQSRWLILGSILGYSIALVAFFICPGFYLLRLVNKIHFNIASAFLLSLPVTIGLYCLIFLILYNLHAPTLLYTFVCIGTTAGIMIMAQFKGHLKDIKEIGSTLKLGIGYVIIGTIVALSYVVVNTDNPRQDVTQLSVAQRGFHSLPIDNRLQYDVAKTFANHRPPESCRWDNWHISDRPPLLGLINAFVALAITNPKGYPYWEYQIVSTFLNVIFLLPLTSISVALFNNRKAAFLLPIAVFFNGFLFLNTYYTWPKLFGVFFPLTSFALMLEAGIDLRTMTTTGLLWGMGSLCHTGVILSAPIFIFLYLLFPLKNKKFYYLIPCLLCIVLVNLPWAFYKSAYAIDRNVLLKTHYVPGAKFEKPLAEGILAFMEETPPKEQIKHRLANVRKLFAWKVVEPAFSALISGDWKNYHRFTYVNEFYHPLAAVGPFQIMICALIGLILAITKISGHSTIGDFLDIKLLTFFFLFIVISYMFNAFAKWTEPINHELPYTELVLATGVLAGVSLSYCSILRWLSMGLILLRFGHYLIYTSIRHKFYVLDFFNVCIIFGAVLMLFLACRPALSR
jgi:hypothetical protein